MANAVVTGGGTNYADILSTPYGLKGEISPDLALEQQSLNRRQQLAHLLLQQAGKVAPGQMVGRFYVGPDWKEGLTSLGSGIAGMGATIANQRQQEDISKEAQQTREEDIAEFLRSQKDVPAVPPSNLDPGTFGARAQTVSAPAPRDAVAQAMMAQGGAPAAPPVDPVLPGAKPPGFSGNYPVGEMPDESGWAPKGPIGDLNAEAPAGPPPPQMQVAQAMAPPMQGPVSEGTLGRERTPDERQAALIKLMASRDPQAAAIGRFMAQQEAMKGEKEEQRAATKELHKDTMQNRIDVARENLNRDLLMAGMMGMNKADIEKMREQQETRITKMEIQGRKDVAGMKEDTNKPPSGYRVTKEGNLEAIPGGPAEVKKKGKLDVDTAILNQSSSSMDRLAIAANEAMTHPGLAGITGIKGAFPNIPGGQAADAQAKLNTLKSQVAFGVLQDMRNNSKTGGALGQISDAEGKRLEANLAALDNAQSETQMKESLQKIIDYANGAKDRLHEAYSLKYGEGETVAPKPPPTPETANTPTPSIAPFHDPAWEKEFKESFQPKFNKEHR